VVRERVGLAQVPPELAEIEPPPFVPAMSPALSITRAARGARGLPVLQD
jgi:hypothetical protein